MNEKIQAHIPISFYPCMLAQDRREMTPDAFQRQYGSDVTVCDCVDHNDPKFKKESDVVNKLLDYPRSPNQQYQQDLSNERTKAEALVYNGISNLIPSCANHANNVFKHFLLGMERHLQLLRPNLNPGEGENTQRRFRQRVLRKEDTIRKFLKDVAKRSDNGKIDPESFTPDPDWGSEGLGIFESNEQPPLNHEIGSIMEKYMDWDHDPDEE